VTERPPRFERVRDLAARSRRPSAVLVLLLSATAAMLLAPVAYLLWSSFVVGETLPHGHLGGANWARIASDPVLLIALLNTVSLALARQALALCLGVLLAWLIACSDLPCRRLFEVGFWIALFMPPLPAILSWILLLGGNNSLVSRALTVLPLAHPPAFHIFSWWGIVLVHMLGATLAVKVFLLVPALRAIDRSFEEAARACGASLARTLRSVALPLLAPAIIVSTLIGVVRSMQSFEIELILGAPAGIEVYSTLIYRAMTHEPSDQGLASALSIAFLLALSPFVILQQWYVRAAAHGVISGKIRTRRQPLGRLKWPAFAFVGGIVALMTVVPTTCLLISTFMPLFGIFDLPDPWTIDNWRSVWSRGDVVSSLWNSLKLGGGSALAAMGLFTALAYHIVRNRSRLAALLDFCTWLPTLLPGVVLSLGLLQMFSGMPILDRLYGTVGSLGLAVLFGSVTVGVQFLKTSIRQLGHDLEEAGWACGGGRLYVLRRVVLPLIAPSVTVVGLETFAAAIAAVGVISLLGVGSTQPLSILQLNLLTSGQFEAASVVGLTILTLTIGAALAARWLADRFSLEAAR